MAFDMYLGKKREQIHAHDESLFSAIAGNPNFPHLNWLWENFYKSPRINPSDSNLLVHELISFKGSNSDKSIDFLVDRLISFFSDAYVTGGSIVCSSD